MILKLNVTIKNLSLFCIAVFVFLLASCKSDKESANPAEMFDGPSTINFLVNSEQIPNQDRINKDYTMGEYREDRMNKDHVLSVPIYDTIYFKDISQFKGDAPGKRRWYIDEEELNSNSKEVAFYSEIAGPAIVTMKFDDFNYVMKAIYFTDAVDMNDPVAEEEVTEDTGEMTMMKEDDMVSADDVYNEVKEEKPVVAKKETSTYQQPKSTQSKPSQSTVSNSTSSYQQPKPKVQDKKPIVQKPAPVVQPKNVEVQKVDFSVSKTTVETGESISFQDMSVPTAAVKNQVWDWGDGNTMSIKRGGVKYSYLKAGTYTVKLCLNYSSKCASKKITVKEAKKPIIVAPVKEAVKEPVKEKVEEKKVVKISKVSISSASKTLVGKPIEIKDESFPAEAVQSREWFINGVKSNLTNKRFSKTFEKAGTYNVKLCLNGGSSYCQTKTITVEEKPKPKPKPEPVKEVVENKSSKPAAVETEFFAMDASRSGLRSSQRCPDSDVEFYQGESEMTLAPKVRLELMNARIYGQKVALAKVTLTALDGSFTRKINNVQILPGPSTIEFGDFGVILQAGKKYKLKIEPMSGSEDVALENGGKCNTTFASDNRLGVTYKDNVMTLFDIKFGFE